MARTDKNKFSPTMRSCLHYAKEHGGIIVRHPGGFWAKRNWRSPSDGPWFGTSTVEALETRGAGQYTEWQTRSFGGGRFPVEFTVDELSLSTPTGE